MLFKSIRHFRLRQLQTQRYVDFLCASGPLEIIVDNEGISQQTTQGIASMPWAQVGDPDVNEAFIYITDGSHEWLYPKASMQPGEFEKLVEVITANIN